MLGRGDTHEINDLQPPRRILRGSIGVRKGLSMLT